MSRPPPDTEWSTAMAVADRVMMPILGDRAMWVEEAGRTDAASLSWPPQIDAEGCGGLLEAMAVTAVEQVLVSMYLADSGQTEPSDPRFHARVREIVPQLDPADPYVQVILRVVCRAIVTVFDALRDQFGGKRGAHRLSGKREFFNWIKAREVDAAVRSGVPRAEALGALPMSRAAAYRAMRRPMKRR